MTRFSCPTCKTVLQASAEQAGKTIACSQCGTQIRVPNRTAALPDPPRPQGPEVPGPSSKELVENTGRLAKSLAQFAADIVQPQDSDEYAKGPAVFLRDQYFGGRTRIGNPLSAMRSFLFHVAAALFSWPYLVAFLQATTSAWEFLPYSHTELVRINLRQRILWRRLLPVFAVWLACMVVVVFSIAFSMLHPFIGALVWLSGWVFSNLGAALLLRGVADKATRSQITLQYGFPTKYQLLSGVSDAPVEEQIDGVLKLCDALAKAQFSRWDQFSSHAARDGMVGAVFSRVAQLFGQR